ncbi:hypothetical protein ACKAV7_014617 [Fusarium commune]
MEHYKSLSDELGALLSQHFQVVATHSQRQDQYYKRSYKTFASKHGARKPLILAPRDSREEWVPQVRRFVALLADELEASCERRVNGVTSQFSNSKLFSDQVLDEAHTRPLCLAVSGPKSLSPDTMQITWWTAKTQHADYKSRRVRGIKALIACGEVDPLLRLAAWPQTRPQQEFYYHSTQWRSLNRGWETVVDDILVIMLFLAILEAFPEDFVAEDGYKYWVPVAFRMDRLPFAPYIEAHGGKMPSTPEELRQEMSQCIAALVVAQSWSANSNFSPIKWESRIMNSFLCILGFEAWNRSREGEGYLGCDLNVTKDTSWLRGVADENGDDEDIRVQQVQQRKYGSAAKPIDPLKLSEPKQEVIPELDEEEQRQWNELAALESYEANYGRKRINLM